jgi:hypothetical protein
VSTVTLPMTNRGWAAPTMVKCSATQAGSGPAVPSCSETRLIERMAMNGCICVILCGAMDARFARFLVPPWRHGPPRPTVVSHVDPILGLWASRSSTRGGILLSCSSCLLPRKSILPCNLACTKPDPGTSVVQLAREEVKTLIKPSQALYGTTTWHLS